MDKRAKQDNDIRKAIDARFSGVNAGTLVRWHVLQKIRGEKKVKKKLSAGFILALILVILSVTALAAALLSAQEVIEQQVVPLALQNDDAQTNKDHDPEEFSNEELAAIVKIAEENGITLSGDMITALEGGQGYYEEELIMALAKSQFGPYPSAWTLEQQYWFEETMVAIGFKPVNYKLIPGEGDITYDEALAKAKARILTAYGDDISADTYWDTHVTYGAYLDENDVIAAPTWSISFYSKNAEHNEYHITMRRTGEIDDCYVEFVPDENSTAGEIIMHYGDTHNGLYNLAIEEWVELGNLIKGRTPNNNGSWILLNTTFILPPEGSISLEEAKEIALASVSAEYTTVSGQSCCMDGETPIFKIETQTLRPEDVGTGRYTAIWHMEIDCMTGAIRDKRQFKTGTDVSSLIRWVPVSVIENLPPRPSEGGEGGR